jgi:hypothetical protein
VATLQQNDVNEDTAPGIEGREQGFRVGLWRLVDALTARRFSLRKNSILEWDAASYSTALNLYDRGPDQSSAAYGDGVKQGQCCDDSSADKRPLRERRGPEDA